MALSGVDQNNPPPEYTPLGISQWIQDVAFSANDGTEAAPGIAFDSENSTGFWRPGSGQIGVTLGGSELLTFKSTGLDFDTGTYNLLFSPDTQTVGNATISIPDQAGVNGEIVTTTAVQTLTNKTLTSPTITSPTISGAIDGSSVIWSDLGQVLTVDIDGGTLDSVVVGGTTPAAGTFSSLVDTSLSGDIVATSEVQTLTNKTLDSFTNKVHAETVHVELRNETGGALQKGDAVYISGYNVGQGTPLVSIADASSMSSIPAIALLSDTSLANNGTGDFTSVGLIEGLDTSAWSEGDDLYVSTAGTSGNTLTSTPPAGATNAVQRVAVVLRSHASDGVIKVLVGRENSLPNYGTMTGDLTVQGTLSTASGTVLDVADIGVAVQAWDADLDTWATKAAPTGVVVGTTDAQTLTNKTINTASNTITVVEADISDLQSYLLPADIGVSVQAYDAGLTSIAGLTTLADRMIYTTAADVYAVTPLTSFARTILDDANAAAVRTTIDVDQAGTDNSTDVTLVTTSHDYLSIVGQAITLGAIDLAGDVTGTLPVASGGTGATSLNNLITLGTHTTGNYVADITAGTAIDVSGGGAESATVTVNVDLSELATSVTDGDGDFFVVVDSVNAQRKLTKANIALSGFNNDAGWTSNTGDIEGVTAGTGLSGGGTSGTVSLDVDASLTHVTAVGTLTTGTWNATAIGAVYGGTGLTTYATGDILYASAVNTLAKLAAGTNGDVLTLAGGVPSWQTPGAPGAHASTHAGGGSDPITSLGAFTLTGDMTINDGNGLVVGHTAQITTVSNNVAELQVLGTGAVTNGDADITIGMWKADATPPFLTFVKSRNGTIGSSTIVQDNDLLGRIQFAPDDGNDFATRAAVWEVEVDDASPAENAIGTAHVWKTSTTAGTLTEGLRIDSSQNTIIPATKRLYLDGGGDTYITESAANQLDFVVGGATDMRLESDGDLHVEGDVIAFSSTISSDINLKTNIYQIDSPMEKINKLRGVTFDWKKEGRGSSVGVIAQEVEKVYPELVDTHALNGMKTVNYFGLIGLLLEGIKELEGKLGSTNN